MKNWENTRGGGNTYEKLKASSSSFPRFSLVLPLSVRWGKHQIGQKTFPQSFQAPNTLVSLFPFRSNKLTSSCRSACLESCSSWRSRWPRWVWSRSGRGAWRSGGWSGGGPQRRTGWGTPLWLEGKTQKKYIAWIPRAKLVCNNCWANNIFMTFGRCLCTSREVGHWFQKGKEVLSFIYLASFCKCCFMANYWWNKIMNPRLTFPPKKCSQQNKAPEGFEPSISCLLDRRFNQLSHGAARWKSLSPFNVCNKDALFNYPERK